MRAKIAILHHGYIPHYRVPLYEMLAARGRAEYTDLHGARPSWVGVAAAEGRFALPERRIENREFRVGPGSAVCQPVVREILTGGYDAVVLSAELKFVSNVVLALLAPLRRCAMLHWGFGYHPQRGFRVLASVSAE